MQGRPISCITPSPPNTSIEGEEDDGRLLAVNSYDNVLRVYDRGSSLQRTMRSAPASAANSSDSHTPQLSLVRAYKGHSNKNWPIRSLFFRGCNHSFAHHPLQEGAMDRPPSIDDSLLLATGSSSTSVYLFDVWRSAASGSDIKAAIPPQGLLQKLRGHTGRVYSCDFHPSEPILASCSADASVKIWMPKTTASRR